MVTSLPIAAFVGFCCVYVLFIAPYSARASIAKPPPKPALPGIGGSKPALPTTDCQFLWDLLTKEGNAITSMKVANKLSSIGVRSPKDLEYLHEDDFKALLEEMKAIPKAMFKQLLNMKAGAQNALANKADFKKYYDRDLIYKYLTEDLDENAINPKEMRQKIYEAGFTSPTDLDQYNDVKKSLKLIKLIDMLKPVPRDIIKTPKGMPPPNKCEPFDKASAAHKNLEDAWKIMSEKRNSKEKSSIDAKKKEWGLSEVYQLGFLQEGEKADLGTCLKPIPFRKLTKLFASDTGRALVVSTNIPKQYFVDIFKVLNGDKMAKDRAKLDAEMQHLGLYESNHLEYVLDVELQGLARLLKEIPMRMVYKPKQKDIQKLEAWKLITKENIRDASKDSYKEQLVEWGVYEDFHLQYLENDELIEIAKMLKEVKMYQFCTFFGITCPDSNDEDL